MGKFSFLAYVFFIALNSQAMTLEVSNAPTDNLSLTTSAILSAQKTILLNIYELSSAQVASAILNRVQAGVQINILEEGAPVGGLSTAAKGIQSQIAQAMRAQNKGSHFYQMGGNPKTRRFVFDHAKYAVIDGVSLLIGSENYSPTGNPEPGSIGNRGWEVFIHDQTISNAYAATFIADSSLSFGDVTDLTARISLEKNTDLEFVADLLPSFEKTAENARPSLVATSVQKITSPDTSEAGLLALINQSRVSLDIQQMTFDPAWGYGGHSPLLAAVIAAANRGVKVRVLVNDDNVFAGSKPKNTLTVTALNQAAQASHLNLVARVANVQAMGVDYIHNKGVIADGTQTLISSINWDQNSILKNREAAVLISSPAVYQYYEALFNQDWNASATRTPFLSTSFQCPSSIHLSVGVGEITTSDAEDADFRTLSHQKIEDNFVRVPRDHDCIFENAGRDDSSIEGHQVLELRQKSNGSKTIIFEGYTPKTKKIYSLRTYLDANTDWSGSHEASLYDGSGPSHDKIGTAKIELSPSL